MVRKSVSRKYKGGDYSPSAYESSSSMMPHTSYSSPTSYSSSTPSYSSPTSYSSSMPSTSS